MKRIVAPEILDELPGDDPRALRSRKDLRLINFLMGNERWIIKQLKEEEGSVLELGAGTGELASQLDHVTGLDFQNQPDGFQGKWITGNLFETFPEAEGEVVVANLILHHFDDDALGRLGELIQTRKKLVAVEPWRSRISLAEGALLWPLINEVTRHDMMVSIRAGFRRGELKQLLQMGDDWVMQEEVSLLGGIRVVAWRR